MRLDVPSCPVLPQPTAADAVTLDELLRSAGHGHRVAPDTHVGVAVSGVTHDSTRVAPGEVFVAIRGRRDGADFARDAAARGAAAVVAASPDRSVGVPWIVVEDDRAALADLSAAFHGHPSTALAVAGITGTNGKTTTTHVLETILSEAGRPCGLVGTVETRWPGGRGPAGRTTPEASDLQALLARFVEAGCRHAVMEVSSHSIDLQRVRKVSFAAVGFTNLSQDHLDWHGDLESYYLCKRKLFTQLAPRAPVVACTDDGHGRRLVAELRRDDARTVITCGLSEDADLRAVQLRREAAGQRVRLVGRAAAGRLPVDVDVTADFRMPGRHNASNAALAAGLALVLGASPDDVRRGLSAHAGVRGRLELVAPAGEDDGVAVFVDYAHTPAALTGALTAARETCRGRLVCVFGCGGDRDREKRAPMGRVVGQLADVAIATSDNPRTEDPDAILAQVQAGLEGAAAEVHVVRDRRAAIALALGAARPGDVVVVAGKGHETYQEVGDKRIPFDDREVVRELRRESGRRGN